MRRALVLAAVALAACAELPSRVDDAASLAAAESAFAAQSVRENMRSAFLSHFAGDGVFVRNGWVNANAYLGPRAAPPIVLDWKPAYVETAASGEMGLSTGPWKLTSTAKPDAPPAYGQFVSVWKRAPGAPWKVAVDLGISQPEPALWSQPLEASSTFGRASPAAGSLDAAEGAFARASQDNGSRAAYGRFASPRVRLYRDGSSPRLGREAALASIDDARIAWTVERSETARSGEFGYARGSFAAVSSPQKPLGYFMRVWRLEAGEWRIALDVINPASP